MVDNWDLLIRLFVAALLGGLIGIEREFSDQPAGFRTHLLVSLGAALFTIAGAYGLSDFADEVGFQSDPTRIAAQVVTGIGFLGAGAIIQRGISIRGLTTAAAMWVTAAIGLAMGLGYWEGAVGATFLALAALYGLKHLQRNLLPMVRSPRSRVELDTDTGFKLADLERLIEEEDLEVTTLTVRATGGTAHRVTATFELDRDTSLGTLVERASDLTGVRNVDWNR